MSLIACLRICGAGIRVTWPVLFWRVQWPAAEQTPPVGLVALEPRRRECGGRLGQPRVRSDTRARSAAWGTRHTLCHPSRRWDVFPPVHDQSFLTVPPSPRRVFARKYDHSNNIGVAQRTRPAWHYHGGVTHQRLTAGDPFDVLLHQERTNAYRLPIGALALCRSRRLSAKEPNHRRCEKNSSGRLSHVKTSRNWCAFSINQSILRTHTNVVYNSATQTNGGCRDDELSHLQSLSRQRSLVSRPRRSTQRTLRLRRPSAER